MKISFRVHRREKAARGTTAHITGSYQKQNAHSSFPMGSTSYGECSDSNWQPQPGPQGWTGQSFPNVTPWQSQDVNWMRQYNNQMQQPFHHPMPQQCQTPQAVLNSPSPSVGTVTMSNTGEMYLQSPVNRNKRVLGNQQGRQQFEEQKTDE